MNSFDDSLSERSFIDGKVLNKEQNYLKAYLGINLNENVDKQRKNTSKFIHTNTTKTYNSANSERNSIQKTSLNRKKTKSDFLGRCLTTQTNIKNNNNNNNLNNIANDNYTTSGVNDNTDRCGIDKITLNKNNKSIDRCITRKSIKSSDNGYLARNKSFNNNNINKSPFNIITNQLSTKNYNNNNNNSNNNSNKNSNLFCFNNKHKNSGSNNNRRTSLIPNNNDNIKNTKSSFLLEKTKTKKNNLNINNLKNTKRNSILLSNKKSKKANHTMDFKNIKENKDNKEEKEKDIPSRQINSNKLVINNNSKIRNMINNNNSNNNESIKGKESLFNTNYVSKIMNIKQQKNNKSISSIISSGKNNCINKKDTKIKTKNKECVRNSLSNDNNSDSTETYKENSFNIDNNVLNVLNISEFNSNSFNSVYKSYSPNKENRLSKNETKESNNKRSFYVKRSNKDIISSKTNSLKNTSKRINSKHKKSFYSTEENKHSNNNNNSNNNIDTNTIIPTPTSLFGNDIKSKIDRYKKNESSNIIKKPFISSFKNKRKSNDDVSNRRFSKNFSKNYISINFNNNTDITNTDSNRKVSFKHNSIHNNSERKLPLSISKLSSDQVKRFNNNNLKLSLLTNNSNVSYIDKKYLSNQNLEVKNKLLSTGNLHSLSIQDSENRHINGDIKKNKSLKSLKSKSNKKKMKTLNYHYNSISAKLAFNKKFSNGTLLNSSIRKANSSKKISMLINPHKESEMNVKKIVSFKQLNETLNKDNNNNNNTNNEYNNNASNSTSNIFSKVYSLRSSKKKNINKKSTIITILEEKNNVLQEEKRRLIKYIKPVYDSLSDEEYMEAEDNINVFHPSNLLLKTVQYVLFLFLFYSALSTPFSLAFDLKVNSLQIIIDSITDILVITVFIFNFNTGYFDNEENYIYIRKNIIKNYFKNWFIIDLVSSIPFNTIINVICFVQFNNNHRIINYTNREGIKEDREILMNVSLIRSNISYFYISGYVDSYNHSPLRLLRLIMLFKLLHQSNLKFDKRFTELISYITFSFNFFFAYISFLLKLIYFYIDRIFKKLTKNCRKNGYNNNNYRNSLTYNHNNSNNNDLIILNPLKPDSPKISLHHNSLFQNFYNNNNNNNNSENYNDSDINSITFEYTYNDYMKSEGSKLNYSNLNFIYGKILLFAMEFSIALHIFACLFIDFNNYSADNWIVKAQLDQLTSIYEIYVSAIYFIMTTIFSIGYGDIVAANFYERFYNDFLMLFGIFLYTFAVSYLSNYVYQTDEDEKELNKHVQTVSDLKVFYKLKDNFVNKVVNFLNYNLTGDKFNKVLLFSEMPLSIKRELLFTIYQQEIISFSFLNRIENYDILIQILLVLKEINTIKEEVLLDENSNAEEMFLIKKGKVKLETRVNIMKIVFEYIKEEEERELRELEGNKDYSNEDDDVNEDGNLIDNSNTRRNSLDDDVKKRNEVVDKTLTHIEEENYNSYMENDKNKDKFVSDIDETLSNNNNSSVTSIDNHNKEMNIGYNSRYNANEYINKKDQDQKQNQDKDYLKKFTNSSSEDSINQIIQHDNINYPNNTTKSIVNTINNNDYINDNDNDDTISYKFDTLINSSILEQNISKMHSNLENTLNKKTQTHKSNITNAISNINSISNNNISFNRSNSNFKVHFNNDKRNNKNNSANIIEENTSSPLIINNPYSNNYNNSNNNNSINFSSEKSTSKNFNSFLSKINSFNIINNANNFAHKKTKSTPSHHNYYYEDNVIRKYSVNDLNTTENIYNSYLYTSLYKFKHKEIKEIRKKVNQNKIISSNSYNTNANTNNIFGSKRSQSSILFESPSLYSQYNFNLTLDSTNNKANMTNMNKNKRNTVINDDNNSNNNINIINYNNIKSSGNRHSKRTHFSRSTKKTPNLKTTILSNNNLRKRLFSNCQLISKRSKNELFKEFVSLTLQSSKEFTNSVNLENLNKNKLSMDPIKEELEKDISNVNDNIANNYNYNNNTISNTYKTNKSNNTNKTRDLLNNSNQPLNPDNYNILNRLNLNSNMNINNNNSIANNNQTNNSQNNNSYLNPNNNNTTAYINNSINNNTKNNNSSKIDKTKHSKKIISKYKTAKILTLRSCDSFGEALLFSEEKSPVSAIVTSETCQIYTISKENFNKVLNRFKEQMNDSLYVSFYNYNKLKQVIGEKIEDIKNQVKLQINNPNKLYFSFDYIKKDDDDKENKTKTSIKLLDSNEDKGNGKTNNTASYFNYPNTNANSQMNDNVNDNKTSKLCLSSINSKNNATDKILLRKSNKELVEVEIEENENSFSSDDNEENNNNNNDDLINLDFDNLNEGEISKDSMGFELENTYNRNIFDRNINNTHATNTNKHIGNKSETEDEEEEDKYSTNSQNNSDIEDNNESKNSHIDNNPNKDSDEDTLSDISNKSKQNDNNKYRKRKNTNEFKNDNNKSKSSSPKIKTNKEKNKNKLLINSNQHNLNINTNINNTNTSTNNNLTSLTHYRNNIINKNTNITSTNRSVNSYKNKNNYHNNKFKSYSKKREQNSKDSIYTASFNFETFKTKFTKANSFHKQQVDSNSGYMEVFNSDKLNNSNKDSYFDNNTETLDERDICFKSTKQILGRYFSNYNSVNYIDSVRNSITPKVINNESIRSFSFYRLNSNLQNTKKLNNNSKINSNRRVSTLKVFNTNTFGNPNSNQNHIYNKDLNNSNALFNSNYSQLSMLPKLNNNNITANVNANNTSNNINNNRLNITTKKARFSSFDYTMIQSDFSSKSKSNSAIKQKIINKKSIKSTKNSRNKSIPSLSITINREDQESNNRNNYANNEKIYKQLFSNINRLKMFFQSHISNIPNANFSNKVIKYKNVNTGISEINNINTISTLTVKPFNNAGCNNEKENKLSHSRIDLSELSRLNKLNKLSKLSVNKIRKHKVKTVITNIKVNDDDVSSIINTVYVSNNNNDHNNNNNKSKMPLSKISYLSNKIIIERVVQKSKNDDNDHNISNIKLINNKNHMDSPVLNNSRLTKCCSLCKICYSILEKEIIQKNSYEIIKNKSTNILKADNTHIQGNTNNKIVFLIQNIYNFELLSTYNNTLKSKSTDKRKIKSNKSLKANKTKSNKNTNNLNNNYNNNKDIKETIISNINNTHLYKNPTFISRSNNNKIKNTKSNTTITNIINNINDNSNNNLNINKGTNNNNNNNINIYSKTPKSKLIRNLKSSTKNMINLNELEQTRSNFDYFSDNSSNNNSNYLNYNNNNQNKLTCKFSSNMSISKNQLSQKTIKNVSFNNNNKSNIANINNMKSSLMKSEKSILSMTTNKKQSKLSYKTTSIFNNENFSNLIIKKNFSNSNVTVTDASLNKKEMRNLDKKIKAVKRNKQISNNNINSNANNVNNANSNITKLPIKTLKSINSISNYNNFNSTISNFNNTVISNTNNNNNNNNINNIDNSYFISPLKKKSNSQIHSSIKNVNLRAFNNSSSRNVFNIGNEGSINNLNTQNNFNNIRYSNENNHILHNDTEFKNLNNLQIQELKELRDFGTNKVSVINIKNNIKNVFLNNDLNSHHFSNNANINTNQHDKDNKLKKYKNSISLQNSKEKNASYLASANILKSINKSNKHGSYISNNNVNANNISDNKSNISDINNINSTNNANNASNVGNLSKSINKLNNLSTINLGKMNLSTNNIKSNKVINYNSIINLDASDFINNNNDSRINKHIKHIKHNTLNFKRQNSYSKNKNALKTMKTIYSINRTTNSLSNSNKDLINEINLNKNKKHILNNPTHDKEHTTIFPNRLNKKNYYNEDKRNTVFLPHSQLNLLNKNNNSSVDLNLINRQNNHNNNNTSYVNVSKKGKKQDNDFEDTLIRRSYFSNKSLNNIIDAHLISNNFNNEFSNTNKVNNISSNNLIGISPIKLRNNNKNNLKTHINNNTKDRKGIENNNNKLSNSLSRSCTSNLNSLIGGNKKNNRFKSNDEELDLDSSNIAKLFQSRFNNNNPQLFIEKYLKKKENDLEKNTGYKGNK